MSLDNFRTIYFESLETLELWSRQIRNVLGCKNVNEYYSFSTTLGKGQFGVVCLGVHKESGTKVAIKTITKAKMLPIEVFQ